MADWAASMMEQGGLAAVALLMFLENVFPPIPSEVVMPLAGYGARQGESGLALVILAGSVGSLAGAWFWFLVGRWVGRDRLKAFAARRGRLLTLSPRDVERADAAFARHGGKAVFVGRLVPAVRTLISVPAGMSSMSLRRFLIYTSAGTVLWTAFLAWAGWALGGDYDRVSGWIGPVSDAVVGAILVIYLYRVVTFGRERRRWETERGAE